MLFIEYMDRFLIIDTHLIPLYWDIKKTRKNNQELSMYSANTKKKN